MLPTSVTPTGACGTILITASSHHQQPPRDSARNCPVPPHPPPPASLLCPVVWPQPSTSSGFLRTGLGWLWGPGEEC